MENITSRGHVFIFKGSPCSLLVNWDILGQFAIFLVGCIKELQQKDCQTLFCLWSLNFVFIYSDSMEYHGSTGSSSHCMAGMSMFPAPGWRRGAGSGGGCSGPATQGHCPPWTGGSWSHPSWDPFIKHQAMQKASLNFTFFYTLTLEPAICCPILIFL